MLQTALYDYLRKECDTVTDAYATLQQSPGDAGAIHAMRVGVKKLRAFFLLAKQLPDYTFGAGKHLQTARLIQTIGGASRDTYLQGKHLQDYEKKLNWRFSFAHLLLQHKQATAKEMLETTIKYCSLKRLGSLPERFRNAISDMDQTEATTALSSYLKDQQQRIILPTGRAHHTVWHEVRKTTKTLFYQLSIMEQVLPASHTETLLAHTKKAGELLGQWHDTSELLLFTKAAIAQLKKEKIALPVKSSRLIQLLQLDVKEQLAQCREEVKQLMAASF
ncbi:CHAD domain-containing protein [Chitinophaga sp. 22321]|uniref:CHAD domain-containing protein n=1 Tax=Chitinophaga hostae TaxID=2831022 RepID=A0ABS5IYG9_9BACT|nr:CHAD domain-containing protein [Chitinophaga hostae]MBS0027986.1 CHAD domain-containing protein [Chitinophaga hostae]